MLRSLNAALPWFICAIASVWALLTIFHHQQSSQLSALHKQLSEDASLYVNNPAFLPSLQPSWLEALCIGDLAKKRFMLSSRAYHLRLLKGDIERSSRYLQLTEEALHHFLDCDPANAKAWLDLALTYYERDGFVPKVEHALVLSAQLSPYEAWLSELRLPFFFRLMPLKEGSALQLAMQQDLIAMQHTYEWRKVRVMEKIGISTLDPLDLNWQEAR